MKYLFFSSQHCTPCQAIKPQILKHPQIEIIDVDKKNELAVKFGIMSIPTLLILNKDDSVEQQIDGAKIGKFIRENFKNGTKI